MDAIRELLTTQLDVVFFVYGLAFIVMGIAILLQPKKDSELKIGNILYLLALFGITHGANELLDMWAIIKGRGPALDMIRWFILVISYLYLFEFGRQFFCMEREHAPEWHVRAMKLFGWWLLPVIGISILTGGVMSADFWKVGSIWTRYLLGLPGGLMIGIGFIREYGYEKDIYEPLKVKKYFMSAGAAFLIYGILGGIIVPKGNFFPSNLINTDSFFAAVHLPVQVFRAGCALMAAWAVSGILKIFNWEMRDKLRERSHALKAINEELEQEITEHKQTEKALNASLREKEILLKEIHHRVKNNMQVVSGLLNLQADQIDDKKYIEMFNESRNRIRAMSLVHEKLYQSGDLANIDFNDYITSLAKSLLIFYGKSYGSISMTIEAANINLAIDTAIPCGLIINELVSNSLKHAFPAGRQGEIKIKFVKSAPGEFELTVSDNGAGVPAHLNIAETKTLGLQLVTNLVEHQLQGRVELRRNHGTEFYIRFKEPSYKKRI